MKRIAGPKHPESLEKVQIGNKPIEIKSIKVKSIGKKELPDIPTPDVLTPDVPISVDPLGLLKNIKIKSIPPRKIVFGHGRAIGDALMFSSGIRDFKLLFPDILINIENNFPAVWENNPYIDPNLKKGDPGVEFYKVGYPIINNSNNSYTHFTMGFLLNMIADVDAHNSLPMSIGEFTATFSGGEVGDYDLGVSDKNSEGSEKVKTWLAKYSKRKPSGGLDWLPQKLQNAFGKNDKFCSVYARQRGDIHLTEKEKAYNMITDIYGNNIKYWVVAPGGKSDCTCKIWDYRRFQEVIDYFEGMIKFVVIGRSDHIIEKLKNVIDLTDKFNDDVRGMFPLVYHAEGCVSGVTFLMHLAAAVPPRWGSERKPCVAIYGGREPTSFTAYCNHQILHTNGSFSCSDNGGCWQSRVTPLQTNPSRNKRFCKFPVKVEGRTIPACMDSITAKDVIRAIEKYYDGDIYTYMNPVISKKTKVELVESKVVERSAEKEINVLASLSSKGGGEQSAIMIVKLLRKAGWKVNLFPWGPVHENYKDTEKSKYTFLNGMLENMVSDVPLLFYANDQIGRFLEEGEGIVRKSSMLIVGINYINAGLPKCRWLHKSGKLRGIIFQNTEKKNEYIRDQLGEQVGTELIVLFGAVDINRYLELTVQKREKRDPFVILKHCTPDYRKYTTEESVNQGKKIHLWQKKFYKETDKKLYKRLLKDLKNNVRFEFMEAHKELVNAFPNNPQMVFHKWDSMSVEHFLERGHVYFYRTSNAWRDNLPRGLIEGMATGLCPIVENRDGPADRVQHGKTGFYFCHYDEILLHLKTLERKTDLCYSMGAAAKEHMRKNYDPTRWVEEIERLCLR